MLYKRTKYPVPYIHTYRHTYIHTYNIVRDEKVRAYVEKTMLRTLTTPLSNPCTPTAQNFFFSPFSKGQFTVAKNLLVDIDMDISSMLSYARAGTL